MSARDAKKPAAPVVRAVLLERRILRPTTALITHVHLFARAKWDSSKRAEFKAWVGKIPSTDFERVPQELRSRSRTNGSCLEPGLAQEWAYETFDEYENEVWEALRKARPFP